MIVQLNLLPDLKKEFIKAQKNKALVISIALLISLGSIGLSALLFVYVTFVQQVQINLATSDISAKAKQLKGVHDINKYLTVQNQLTSLPDLHTGKGAYSRLFTFLNVLNPSAPNNITLNSLQVSQSDTSITFTGTSPTFQTLNVFVDTLKNAQVIYTPQNAKDASTGQMFSQVLVQSSGLSKQNGGSLVSFTVKALYTGPVFDAHNTSVSAKVPNIVTTPSVTNSPAPLFNSNAGENK